MQGSSGSVSVAGFVSGGGVGVLSRTYGLAADHVLSIDVVTADGRLRTVDARHDLDLFWALRGGKGNFGVITGLRLSLIPLTAFYGGGLFFDGAHASTVLHGYRRWITSHSDRTSSSVALLRLPPDPGVPEALRGRFVVHVRMAHVGDHEEGARLAADVRRTAPVLLDLIGELTPAAMDAVHQDPPGPMPTYEQACRGAAQLPRPLQRPRTRRCVVAARSPRPAARDQAAPGPGQPFPPRPRDRRNPVDPTGTVRLVDDDFVVAVLRDG